MQKYFLYVEYNQPSVVSTHESFEPSVIHLPFRNGDIAVETTSCVPLHYHVISIDRLCMYQNTIAVKPRCDLGARIPSVDDNSIHAKNIEEQMDERPFLSANTP